MPPTLPTFRYHPDPLATGNVTLTPEPCLLCKRARGALYVGPIYGASGLDERLCPWCIADGSAARAGAFFCDEHPLLEDGLPEPIVLEIAQRTPGFLAWQDTAWRTHCGDGCAFEGGETTLRFRCLHCGATLLAEDAP